jgi:hypothetical protein
MTEIEFTLLTTAAEQSGLSETEILASISGPNWEARNRIHDWRNHVPSELRGLWFRLSFDARIVAMLFAMALADDEVWE